MSYFQTLLQKKPLVVFEMANNHMGDVAHGIEIIRKYGALKERYEESIQFAIKFQYRELDSFIHKDHKGSELKYIRRFEETRLTPNDWNLLIAEAKKSGFLSICTPFDEPSIEKVVEQNFDIIKVASCSFTDWPLMEQIARYNKPVIASVAGSSEDEISNVAAFLSHRNINFALLFCVGMYPTPAENLNVSMVRELKTRYPDLEIGFSTHENPEETTACAVAIGSGARIFEKHIALPTKKYPQNQYSTNLEQTDNWLKSLHHAISLFGSPASRLTNLDIENESLKPLKRAAFASRKIAKGESITLDDVYFAIPASPDSLVANDFSKFNTFTAKNNLEEHQSVKIGQIDISRKREKVLNIRNKIRALVQQYGLVLPSQTRLEISHHYGLAKFEEYGMCMLTILNNENYCKKYLFILPNQTHPEQYHKIKHETFIVIQGVVQLTLDGVKTDMHAGDIVAIRPLQRHSFTSLKGAIIEEISTHSAKADSFYTDENIQKTENRKSFIELI